MVQHCKYKLFYILYSEYYIRINGFVKIKFYNFDFEHKVTKVIKITFIIYLIYRFNSIGIGGFIFADQFLQISTLLPTSNIYGIGEHRSSLKLNTNWQSFTLFNKDQPPTENVCRLILF